jgi:hypothetical protein
MYAMDTMNPMIPHPRVDRRASSDRTRGIKPVRSIRLQRALIGKHRPFERAELNRCAASGFNAR